MNSTVEYNEDNDGIYLHDKSRVLLNALTATIAGYLNTSLAEHSQVITRL